MTPDSGPVAEISTEAVCEEQAMRNANDAISLLQTAARAS
jgi:flagellin-like hook-associated protein FlgL